MSHLNLKLRFYVLEYVEEGDHCLISFGNLLNGLGNRNEIFSHDINLNYWNFDYLNFDYLNFDYLNFDYWNFDYLFYLDYCLKDCFLM